MIHVGYDERRAHVVLDKNDLKTHVHGIGLTQTGKSRLIEYICRELIKTRKGFCLVDPHGNLYRDFLAWLSFIDPRQKIIPFDTSQETIGYNPFKSAAGGSKAIRTKTDQMVKATLRAWGSKDDADYPRLREWLTHIYYIVIEQQLPISAMRHFLRHKSAERDAILRNTKNDDARYWLEEKYAMPRREFTNYVESVQHRFAMFSHEQVEAIMSGEGIDVATIIEKGQVLLCSFQPSGVISREANRVLGTFLINEFVDYFSTRRKKQEFYLIVDECQRYLTPDIEESVAESAKYGLHLFLFHQQEDQGGRDIERILRNARVKIRFYGNTNRRFRLERPNKEPVDATAPDVNTAPHYRVDKYIKQLTRPFRKKSPQPAPEPVQSVAPPPMPLPTTNRQVAEHLLVRYKCFSSNQIPLLTSRSKRLIQNELRDLAKEGKCWITNVGRLNIYADRENKQALHDVERTDFLLAVRGGITRLQLDGIRDGINPDGYLESGDLCFFLEIERSNPRTEAGESVQIVKAREYDRYAMQGKHKALCDNFRVIFAMQTEAKARNLAEKIRQSVPNPARFWLTWKGNYNQYLSADGDTHTLPIATAGN